MRRLAFVGQQPYFAATSLQRPAGDLQPRFFDFRHGADPVPLLDSLTDFDPDVVFVWRPEIVPAGLFAGLRAVTLGYLTEPLPRAWAGPGSAHPDLEQRLEYLGLTDPANFDRIASFDPLIVPTVEAAGFPVWRSFPIPVDDGTFGPVRQIDGRPRILFVGRSTAHRESFLGPAKHDYDVIHVAHGMSDERLAPLLDETTVALNLHNEPYPTFENRIQTSLARGLLVITEPVSPLHGLQPGIDFLEAHTPWDLWRTLEALERTPDAFRAIRVSGRAQAERFRASHVFPRVVDDLLADVELFGRGRPAAPAGLRGQVRPYPVT